MGRVQKRVLRPARLRAPPREGFGWVDRRLVHEGLIEDLAPTEGLLYLFLLCVADKDGLSFYGDRTLTRMLGITPPNFERARRGLVEKDLIAYERPLYQVLALPRRSPPPIPTPSPHPPKGPAAEPQEIGAILARHLPALPIVTRHQNPRDGEPRKTPESGAF
jgi:hypothetical protein